MGDIHDPGAFEQGVMVDVGPGMGALVIHAREELTGREIEISRSGDDTNRVHADFLRRATASGRVCAAVFPSLREGDYRLWQETQTSPTDVRIVGGEVVEIDWP